MTAAPRKKPVPTRAKKLNSPPASAPIRGKSKGTQKQVQQRILVIKTGALGDFIQALGAMRAIRKHHPKAKIILLTTKPYVDLGKACGYFDGAWLDPRPKGMKMADWRAWRKRLRDGKFTRVYDLQNTERTALYSWLMAPQRPEWIGAAPFASHRNASPDRIAGHAFDGHVQTLGGAGIKNITVDDLSWVKGNISKLHLPRHFALLVPGCAPGHLEKRWPADRYGELADWLRAKGLTPVVIGTRADVDAVREIIRDRPFVVDLTGKTALLDLAPLARKATLAVGNDTGPIHLIAATGCPTIALFSARSDPVRAKPKGGHVQVLRRAEMVGVSTDEVIAAVTKIMRRAG